MDFEDGAKCLAVGFFVWLFFAVTRDESTNPYSLIYVGIGVLTCFALLMMGSAKGAVIGMVCWFLFALVQCPFKEDLLKPFWREPPGEKHNDFFIAEAKAYDDYLERMRKQHEDDMKKYNPENKVELMWAKRDAMLAEKAAKEAKEAQERGE